MNHGIGLPSSIPDSSTEAIESVEIDRSSDEADHPITGGSNQQFLQLRCSAESFFSAKCCKSKRRIER